MREQFEKLSEIHKIMNENGIHFMNHSGWYEARDFKDFEYEQYINGAWYVFQEVHRDLLDQQKKIDDLNLKIQDLISKYESKTILPILDQWSDCFVKSARGMVNDLKELLND